MQQDYKFLDMPGLLATRVTRQDPHNREMWILDEGWYDRTRRLYASLLSFFQDNALIRAPASWSSIDEVVLMFSDLTDDGQALVRSGADDSWIDSFDRPGSKKDYANTKSLQRALDKIRRPVS